MKRAGSRWAALAGCLGCLGCGGASGGGLEIVMAPMDAVIADPFPFIVRARDGTAVSVALASGGGALGGMLTRIAMGGMAHFDLSYDRWENIAITARAPGSSSVESAPFPVRPVMRFVEPLPVRARTGAGLGPIRIELADGRGQRVASRPGQTVRFEPIGAEPPIVPGGLDRPFVDGRAGYDAVVPIRAGPLTLLWKAAELGDLMHGLTVDAGSRVESLWLPGGRVGLPYQAALPAGATGYRIVAGALPAGLSFDGSTGGIARTPAAAIHARFEVTGTGSSPTTWLVDLSVFPAIEAPAALDALDADGPWGTLLLRETVDVASRGKKENVRILVPSSDGKTAAAGRFPLVVFHHGAAGIDASHPTIYERYDALLRRWATRGLVVATVDGADLIVQGGSYVPRTLGNLTAMSENQRATIAHVKARNLETGHPLAGRVDVDRILVSGHSRGGGASLITLRVEPGVMGAILLKPVDPLTAPGGETLWDVPLPAKPLLLNIAGSDADLAYPTVDFLYERRSAPMSAHTIVGTVHTFSKAALSVCAPETGAKPTITREQDWAITNAYAAAFLEYVTRGDITRAPLLFDRDGLSTGLSPMGVLTRGDGRIAPLLVDDFQDGDPGKNLLGGANMARGFSSSVDEPSMKSAIGKLPPSDSRTARLKMLYGVPKNLAFSNAHRLAWSAAGASYRTELPAADVGGRGAFMLRARSDEASLAGGDFRLVFRDAAGGAATIAGAGHVGRNGLSGRYSEVIVPITEILAAGADVTRLTAVEIEIGASSGTLFVDDLRFE